MTDIDGQLVLGRDCAWCGNRFIAAKKVWVCVRHMDMGKEKPMGRPLQRKDKRYVQTDILSALDDGSAKGSAILGG